MHPNLNLSHSDLSNLPRGKRLPVTFRRRLSKVSREIFIIARRFSEAAWQIDCAVNISLVLRPHSLDPKIALGEILDQRRNLLDAIEELDTILTDASNAVPQDLESNKSAPIKRGDVA